MTIRARADQPAAVGPESAAAASAGVGRPPRGIMLFRGAPAGTSGAAMSCFITSMIP